MCAVEGSGRRHAPHHCRKRVVQVEGRPRLAQSWNRSGSNEASVVFCQRRPSCHPGVPAPPGRRSGGPAALEGRIRSPSQAQEAYPAPNSSRQPGHAGKPSHAGQRPSDAGPQPSLPITRQRVRRPASCRHLSDSALQPPLGPPFDREDHAPMSIAFAAERRRLTADELGPIRRSHFPSLEQLSREEVNELARWLRARRDRARDLMRDHRRSKHGKSVHATTPPLPDADRGPRGEEAGLRRRPEAGECPARRAAGGGAPGPQPRAPA